MGRDRVSKEKRSEIMSKIKSRDTKPELHAKRLLEAANLPYIPVYHPPAPFKPEFILCGSRTAIFVDGDFWHGHLPIPLDPFWVNKITRNIMREREANAYYTSYKWDVMRIKESTLKKVPEENMVRYLRLHFDAVEAEGRVWRI